MALPSQQPCVDSQDIGVRRCYAPGAIGMAQGLDLVALAQGLAEGTNCIASGTCGIRARCGAGHGSLSAMALAALFGHPVNSVAGDLLLNDRPGLSDYHLKSEAVSLVKPVSVMVVPSPRLRMVLPPTTLAFFSTVLVS